MQQCELRPKQIISDCLLWAAQTVPFSEYNTPGPSELYGACTYQYKQPNHVRKELGTKIRDTDKKPQHQVREEKGVMTTEVQN